MKKKRITCHGFLLGIYWFCMVVLASLSVFALYMLICNLCCKCDNESASLYAILLQSTIMCISALIAIKTYRQSRRVENVRALLDFRRVLASEDNKKIHQHIGNNKDTCVKEKGDEPQLSKQFIDYWNSNKYNIYDYLGTLELINIFIQQGIIDKEDFLNQYAYRLRNIIKYDELLKKIESQQKKYSGWSDLIELMELADKDFYSYKYPKFK